MERTDIHRPSAIIPEDYDFVGFECLKIEELGDVEAILSERARIAAHMARTGGTYATHEHGGNCMVCGNVFATYTVLFYHAKSNEYVRTGQDCAEKLELSYGDFNRFTERVRDARAAVAGKRKAQAILTDAGLEAAWLWYANPREHGGPEEGIIVDIVSRLVRYGSLSEKQLAYLPKLLDKIARRAEVAAQRAAEAAAAAPCPTGRVVVTGVVLTTKVVDSDFNRFGTLKMLLKDDSGFKVWGTVPAAVSSDNFKPGSRLTIRATVTPSKDDPKFGFFKRPTLLAQPAKEVA